MQHKVNNAGTMTIMQDCLRCCIPIKMKMKIKGCPKNLTKRYLKPTKKMSDDHLRCAKINQVRGSKLNFPYKLKNPSCPSQKQISIK